MVSTPNQRYRRPNDPYMQMEEAIIRPSDIKRQLSEAEQAASKTDNDNTPLISDRLANSLRNYEANQTSSNLKQPFDDNRNTHRNSVTGRQYTGSNRQHQKSKDKTRKGPIALLIGFLIGGGSLFYGASSMFGPLISALYTQATDVQFTSYHMRNARIFKYMLDGGNQVKVSNFTKRYTTFTPYMKKRLSKNGIEVGYIDSAGNFKTDQILANHSTVLRYNGETITANDFQQHFAADMNFREAYTKAKRGRVAGFFDDAADRFYTNKRIPRDIYDNHKATGDSKQDTEAFKETVTEHVGSVDGTIETGHHEKNEETGEDEIRGSGEKTETGKIKADAETKARAIANSVASKVSDVAVPVCTVLRVANMIAITASVIQTARAIAYFHSIMEPISKAKAGEGSTSGVNETLNFLVTPTTSEVESTDENGNPITKTVYGAPIQSAGARVKLGNTITQVSDAADYTIGSITRAATTIAVSTGATNTVCAGAMAASAIVSLASIAVPGGALAKFVIGAVVQTAGGIAITWAVSALINAVTPFLARIIIEDVFEKYTGIPAGNLFDQGDSASKSQLATNASGFMPSSSDRVDTQNHETIVALREEAELDRYNRSPFDTTSTNTFLGSLLSQFTFAAYTKTPSTFISSITNTFGRAVRSLTPAASAYSEDLMYNSIYQPCEFMKEAVCDMYGVPITATDFSTIDIDPDDATYEAVISRNLEYTDETSRTTTTAVASPNSGSIWSGKKYTLNDGELRSLIAVAGAENGSSLNALKTELSFFANLYEYRKSKGISDAQGSIVEFIRNSSWFSSRSRSRYDTNYEPEIKDSLEAARDILVNGNRTIPPEILEHDCINCGSYGYDITSAENNGVEIDRDDRSQYIRNVTVLHNRYGSDYVFWDWADPDTKQGDPFGYKVGTTVTAATGKSNSSASASVHNISNGGHKVKENSELAKFINFCVNRESPWGVKDANILSALQTDGGIVLNNMPVVNDILDVINAAEDIANEDWATGANCLNSSSNPRWDSEMKYYQRYVEDMRILGTMEDNSGGANPIMAYEADYEETHPIDTSYEGTLARMTGQTKEDIAFMLEYVEYSTMLANYHPEERYAFGATETEPQIITIDNSQPGSPVYATIIDPVSIFIDRRNYHV